jgi:nitric oxide synthase oxygenase domain/subunit
VRHDLSLARIANQIGGTTLQIDISTADAPERIAAHLRDRFDGVDIVVHNAGITRDRLLANMKPEVWESVVDITYPATTRALSPSSPPNSRTWASDDTARAAFRPRRHHRRRPGSGHPLLRPSWPGNRRIHDGRRWGARVAWRNNAPCVGRLSWSSLRVRDLRAVQAVDEMAYHCVEHIRVSLNRGNIRPVVSVFAPETPASPGMRILSGQLLGYAGYDRGGRDRLVDRNNRDLTMLALRSGWPAPRPPTPFDVLPLLIRDFDGHVHVRRLPPEAVPEVRLRHPELNWLEDLGLRWFAIPVVSDMALYIGGINYPAAPFSGWFMSSEIAIREAGRACPADWSWIVPPVSSNLTPVFHQYYEFPSASGPQLYHPYTTTGRANRDRDYERRRTEL